MKTSDVGCTLLFSAQRMRDSATKQYTAAGDHSFIGQIRLGKGDRVKSISFDRPSGGIGFKFLDDFAHQGPRLQLLK